MLCDVVVFRRRRCWAHAPVIHAASHFCHEKRVAWVSISMPGAGKNTLRRLALFVYLDHPTKNDVTSGKKAS